MITTKPTRCGWLHALDEVTIGWTLFVERGETSRFMAYYCKNSRNTVLLGEYDTLTESENIILLAWDLVQK